MAKNAVVIVREDAVDGVEIFVEKKIFLSPMTFENGWDENGVKLVASQTIPLSSAMTSSPSSLTLGPTSVNGDDDASSDFMKSKNLRLFGENKSLEKEVSAVRRQFEGQEAIIKSQGKQLKEVERKNLKLEDLLKRLKAQYTGFKSGMDHCFGNAMKLIDSQHMEPSAEKNVEKRKTNFKMGILPTQSGNEEKAVLPKDKKQKNGNYTETSRKSSHFCSGSRVRIYTHNGDDDNSDASLPVSPPQLTRCDTDDDNEERPIIQKLSPTNRKMSTKCGKQTRKAKQALGRKRGAVGKAQPKVARPSRISSRKINKKNSQHREVRNPNKWEDKFACSCDNKYGRKGTLLSHIAYFSA